uniref:caspase, EACC1-associated type n=1 Tax=Streptomyces sp. CHD11 TaxID=2741325 RepID=UPI00203F9981|nr:caspase family protein [Streptomyces sp. CHD11]
MSAGRHALLVATGRYHNEALRRLRSPARDARELAEVLADPRIGGFEVTTAVDRAHHEVTQAIEHFFLDRRRDDLLLLHISCHGLKNDDGELHFAAADTDQRLLASTSVPAQFVRRQMNLCRARSIVLLLDCCYSGAFLTGSKGDTTVHVGDELAGHGRVVLTATNRTEYAWEGERVTELGPEPSRFTGALVKGLRSGEADRDRDGVISVHELYDYVYEELRDAGVRQRPQMWAELEHRVVLARSVLARPALSSGGGQDTEAVPTAGRDAGPPPSSARAPDPAPVGPASAPLPAGFPRPEERREPRTPHATRTPLLVLTEVLTGLTCMEDAGSRAQFAAVLGDLFGRRIDLRGVRQREDVVAIVRAALMHGSDGTRALLSVVEVFEGHLAAGEIRRGLTPCDHGATRPGPVTNAPDPVTKSPRPAYSGPQGFVPGSRTGADGARARSDRDPVVPELRPGSRPAYSGPQGFAPGSRSRGERPRVGSQGSSPADDRSRGLLRLGLLTDGLCELSCMDTPQGRAQFAALLAEQLGRPVDLRGTRLREDAVAIVRAALSVPGGDRTLVEVVRILEGGPAGDDIEWLLDAPD